MTRNKDFKMLVRARMARTGESYAAARAQLAEAPPPPEPDEYADLAGMSDEAVSRSTGRTWAEWKQALDAVDAHTLDHAGIAALVGERWPESGPWWAQTVTVGYERIRGLRVLGQKSTGDFAASKSKTFPVPVSTLYAACADEDRRTAWMGETTVVRTANTDRSLRLTWPDGTIVALWFTDKGPDKSSVSVQHEKLESKDRREHEKVRWGERLGRLKGQL